MYPRYYPQRSGMSQGYAQRDVVPRELAAKIARERDMLYEELQRTQQAFKRGEQQRADLEQRLSAARPLSTSPTQREQQQAKQIRALEQALADMTRQRDAAEYSAQLFSELDPGPDTTAHSDSDEKMSEEHDDGEREEAPKQEQYSSHEELRDLISSMLELRDSIERASAMSSDKNNPWKQGLDHMVNQFDEILNAHGWVTLGEVGEPFDPHIHEAIGVHDAEQEQEIEIHEVSRRGFAHEATGEILRPAQVIVSK